MLNLQSLISQWIAGQHPAEQAVASDSVADFSGSPTGVVVDLGSQQAVAAAGPAQLSGSVSHVIGSPAGDTLIGGSAPAVLEGGAGNDVLIGGSGVTQFAGGTGNDVIIGGRGHDTVSYAAQGPVRVDLAQQAALDGQGGRDTLVNVANVVGSPHADVIVGDARANVITGGFGADRLTGGGGHDTFVYNDRFDFGDRITDFVSGVDTIAVSRANIWVGTPPPAGRLDGAQLTVTTDPAHAHTPFVFNPETHLLSVDVDGAGPLAPLPLATLDHATIKAGDILLF
jgi:Ca2+-binding RTX toxin-like protein